MWGKGDGEEGALSLYLVAFDVQFTPTSVGKACGIAWSWCALARFTPTSVGKAGNWNDLPRVLMRFTPTSVGKAPY